MQDSNELGSLDTRRAVRDFLARGLDDLSGGSARPRLPSDLAGLSTGSDREVIDACRLLDKCYDGRGAAQAGPADAALGSRIRELFSQALRRMKQLPPDPREPVPAHTPAAADGPPTPGVRRKQA
jgi:hypothetical protein